MSGDETLQKRHDESDSEEEEDDVEEQIPAVDVDISKLHPLSPEVISKQVCGYRGI
jgi:translation initiation factor 2 subunit 3